MYCPRLDHFVRFNADGTIGKCGHMIDAPGFDSWEDMQSSPWLADLRRTFQEDRWPSECRRCQATEPNHSIRLDSIRRHDLLRGQKDYLILGGVLDNVCNSACQSCNANLSTKIGSLSGRDYPRINNQRLFDQVPMHRVVEIDVNGGEPTASPNYQHLLENLPESVRILRINTNGSRVMPNLQKILQRGVHVIITLSLDGTGKLHDYVRWPISWSTYQHTVEVMKAIKSQHNNLTLQAWTTVHALNLSGFDSIKTWASEQEIKHSWAYLDRPRPLNVRYSNSMTEPFKHLDPANIAIDSNNQSELDSFIQEQDQLRSITIKDYM